MARAAATAHASSSSPTSGQTQTRAAAIAFTAANSTAVTRSVAAAARDGRVDGEPLGRAAPAARRTPFRASARHSSTG